MYLIKLPLTVLKIFSWWLLSRPKHLCSIVTICPVYSLHVYVLSCSAMSDFLWPHGQQPARSSVHGVLQAEILEWEDSQPKDWNWVFCMQADSLPSEPPRKLPFLHRIQQILFPKPRFKDQTLQIPYTLVTVVLKSHSDCIFCFLSGIVQNYPLNLSSLWWKWICKCNNINSRWPKWPEYSSQLD